MIIIDSSENLISSVIRNRVQAADQKAFLFSSRDHRQDMLQPLKLRLHNETMGDPIKYFIIIENPFNVYDVYNQIKSLLRIMTTLHAAEVYIHAVIKLNMQDVFTARHIRSQCTHLASLIGHVSGNSAYRLHTMFSSVYNVYGMFHSTIMNLGSNSVQALLYTLKNADKQLTVPYAEKEDVIGIDVEDAVSILLQRTHPDENTTLNFLPVNESMTAESLMDNISRAYPGRYPLIRYSAGGNISVEQVLEELQCREYGADIAERILSYMD
jgi:hypothetical protein